MNDIQPQQPRAKRSLLSRCFRIIRRYPLITGLILLALWSYGFYSLGVYTTYASHPELAQANQANEILTKVGRLINLPTGETPQMAAINDAASAKQAQPFLKDAQNGDVLIVYQQAGEAILYRPSTNKLIAVGPVQNQPTTGTQAITSPATVASSSDASSTIKSKK